MGSLPIPLTRNSEVAIDIIFPLADKNLKCLFMMDTLSEFVQVQLVNTSTQEDVARSLWEEWISKFGAPGRVTADCDVRWNMKDGVWSQLLKTYGVDQHLTTPYRKEAKGRCERHIQEFGKMLRMVKEENKDMSAESLLSVAVSVLNARPHEPSGLSSFEMFQPDKHQWYGMFNFESVEEKHFVKEFHESFDRVRDRLSRERKWRLDHRKYQPESDIRAGDYVLISVKRFPSFATDKTSSPWVGPLLVVSRTGRELLVDMGKTNARVDLGHVKK
jgi:hypothetical protein